MSFVDPERREELVQSLRKAAGRTSKRKETAAKESERPKEAVVDSSGEDTGLNPSEDSWESLWSYSNTPDEELQDGTNLPAGTNYTWRSWKSERWFEPSAGVESPNWRETLQRLSERMKAFQLQGKRFPVFLIQTQTPRLGASLESQLPSRFGYSSGNGLGLEPAFLKPEVVVICSFAFPDPVGKPIVTETGEPVPLRLGFNRMHFIKGASTEELELFSDAAKVLSVLPAFVSEVLWKRWRQGFPIPEDGFDEGVWIDAVFETAWQQLPFSSLRASRKAMSAEGNSSIVLNGEGLFPRIPANPPFFRSRFPNVHGYPQRIRSELSDLLESSLLFIDTVLAIPKPVDGEAAAGGKPKAAKTGRPVKKKLTKQQLQAIHRRTEKEDLSVIFESYPDFKYHTAYRQYKQWLMENH
jgi:hypothetical protein